MTRIEAPDDATPALRPLDLEAIALTDEEIAAAAERATVESDSLRAWSRYLRCLAITALKHELRRRLVPVVVGPELEPEAPERLLMLNGRRTQLICASPYAAELEVPLGVWREAATAPQLLLVAVVDEDQGVVHIPGVLDAKTVVAWAAGQEHPGDVAPLPLAMVEGGIERLKRWLLLLDADALPQVALASAGPSAAGRLLQGLQEEMRDRLEALLDSLLASLSPQPLLVLSAARGGSAATIELLTPTPQGEQNGIPTAVMVCSRPTIWTREPLAEIQLLDGDRQLWRQLARLKEPITTPLIWPLDPLTGGECYTLRVRPWGAPAGSYATVLLTAPAAETLKETDAGLLEGMANPDPATWLEDARPELALEVMARRQSEAAESER